MFYRDADGYRTERVVRADRVVSAAGVTTFSVDATSGAGTNTAAVVWWVRTNHIESYYDTGSAADQYGS